MRGNSLSTVVFLLAGILIWSGDMSVSGRIISWTVLLRKCEITRRYFFSPPVQVGFYFIRTGLGYYYSAFAIPLLQLSWMVSPPSISRTDDPAEVQAFGYRRNIWNLSQGLNYVF